MSEHYRGYLAGLREASRIVRQQHDDVVRDVDRVVEGLWPFGKGRQLGILKEKSSLLLAVHTEICDASFAPAPKSEADAITELLEKAACK